MRGRLKMVWRNLVLLYLGIFLVMTAWGATSSILNRWAWPVMAINLPDQPRPSLMELLGLWPPGQNIWRRLLQLGIPGLSPPRPRRITWMPTLQWGAACVWGEPSPGPSSRAAPPGTGPTRSSWPFLVMKMGSFPCG